MPRENRLLLVLLQLKSLGIFLTLLHSPDCSFCTALAASWWMSGSRTEFACSELGRVGPLWLGFVNLRYMGFWQISSLSFQPSNVRKIIRIKKKKNQIQEEIILDYSFPKGEKEVLLPISSQIHVCKIHKERRDDYFIKSFYILVVFTIVSECRD